MPAGKPSVDLFTVAREDCIQLLHDDVEGRVSMYHVTLVFSHLPATCLAAVEGSGKEGGGVR